MSSEFESVEVPEKDIQYTQPKGKLDVSTVAHDHNYEDYKARCAGRGIPSSPAADRMEFLEDVYEKWEKELVPLSPVRRGFFGTLKCLWTGSIEISKAEVLLYAAEAFRIFRLEIRELSVSLATELNEKKALEARADIGMEHIKTQAQLAELKHFLMTHFENELDLGRARGQNLYDIAKGIMLMQKSGGQDKPFSAS
jgi:hypothetical protein